MTLGLSCAPLDYKKRLNREGSLEQTSFLKKPPPSTRPVECLGLTFENDAARRAHFLELLRQKLQDPEFRQIEGFPLGADQAILALSDPPYYTACPNPFLGEVIAQWSQEGARAGGQATAGADSPGQPSAAAGQSSPFAADVSVGKNSPLYEAFSYHTKVPPQAIQAYLEHYCPPGGVVLDGFCGSGMVGLAARLSGRKAVLVDLAPAATAIAAAYCLPVDAPAVAAAAKNLAQRLQQECGWLYQASAGEGLPDSEMDYMIWSEQYRCPNCQAEFLFSEVGFDFEQGRPVEALHCPRCDAQLGGSHLERCLDHTGKTVEKPVQIKRLGRRPGREAAPTPADLSLLQRIEEQPIPYPYPEQWMMNTPPGQAGWGDMWRRGYHSGYWKVPDFFYKRTLWTLAAALHFIETLEAGPAERAFLRRAVTNLAPGMTKMRRAYQGILPLVLYLPRMRREVNVIRAIESKLQRLAAALNELPAGPRRAPHTLITTQSSTGLSKIPDQSIDYIFTDPPFGDNIIYSEVNFFWESLLGVFTSQPCEAIISNQQRKKLPEYQALMSACFGEFYRLLKPGRWMTVEFHNSRNSIWNAIQDALQAAGFVVADVRILDKQQGSFKQVSTAGAVKQDLVISAYKPSARLEQEARLRAGDEAAAWDFVREHLGRLPVYVEKAGQIEVVAERQNYLLFDRMLAFHIQRQAAIPLSAQAFYAGLRQRFPERDGMFFLPEQAAVYDQKRVMVSQVQQLPLLVSDEASAIQWLRRQLERHPQTYQELHPLFTRELTAWRKNETPLDLLELLQENFLRDEDGPIPPQIAEWWAMNSGSADPQPAAGNLTRDRWYVPDPSQAQDLEKLRERGLLREFEQYRAAPGKTLKVFRLEALRAGFKKAWQEKEYATIITIAQKIPDEALQEDPKLLMWYDQALTRADSANLQYKK